jgi:hypothetical protein
MTIANFEDDTSGAGKVTPLTPRFCVGRPNIPLLPYHGNLDKLAAVASATHGGSPGSIQNQQCTSFVAATDRRLITVDAAISILMTLWSALLVMCAPQAALGADNDPYRYNRCCSKCKALHRDISPTGLRSCLDIGLLQCCRPVTVENRHL